MRKYFDTGPPGGRNGANNHERAESKAAANLARVYSAHEFEATWNHLEPGTLTQGHFPFVDGREHDSRIVAYHAQIGRELTDDQLRNYCRARHAYGVFQRLGTPEARRYAWFAVQLAVRLAAKSGHSNTAGTPRNAVLGQPAKPEPAEGGQP